MKLLIDAELYLYRAAAAAEQEVEWDEDVWSYFCDLKDAQSIFQEIVAGITGVAPDHVPTLVVGGRKNFRYGIWSKYKSKRKGRRKPAGFAALLEWLQDAAKSRGWEFRQVETVEGDDALGIEAIPGTIIASDDKDLLTVPGVHLRKGEIVEVSYLDADKNFLIQTLTGDQTDGYPGCPGMGEVRARKALAEILTVEEGWRIVTQAYQKAGLSVHYALTQARCARILRPGEFDHVRGEPILWEPPA